MKYLVLISRLIVGSLFIVSGLVKANDPLGFSYKLEEYFSAAVFDMPALEPWAFTFACLLVIGEVALGVAVLIGGKMKLTTFLLLFLTVMFGFLTWYSAEFEVVKDCGCFGDALKGSIGRSLTPWESFWKDVILLIFVLIILIGQLVSGWSKLNTDKEDMVILPISTVLVALLGWGLFGWPFTILFTLINFALYFALKKILADKGFKEIMIAFMVLFLASGFTWYNYNHLPIKDYRPYRVGANIAESRKSCTDLGLQCPEYANVYIMTNKATGETKEINSKDYISTGIWEDENWEITETLEDPITLVDGYESPIHDFGFDDPDEGDITEMLLADEGYTMMVFSYDLQALGVFDTVVIDGYEQEAFDPYPSTVEAYEKIKGLSGELQGMGVTVKFLSNSTWERMDVFKHKLQLDFGYWRGDGILLKTIVRANPGVLLMKGGVVVGKWHWHDLPDLETMKSEYVK